MSGSSAGNEIKSGDRIMIKTRRNYTFNCEGSVGKCQAIENANDNYRVSDEIFKINFL